MNGEQRVTTILGVCAMSLIAMFLLGAQSCQRAVDIEAAKQPRYTQTFHCEQTSQEVDQ